MKEALYYEKKENNTVVCSLCPNNCIISNRQSGMCNVRINNDGVLVTTTYAKPVSVAIDPIEKKPLYHFYPGKPILSLGTIGCNLKCMHCQNYDISQARPNEVELNTVSSLDIVKTAKNEKIGMIAFTYNEPTVFYEYMLDIAKYAKKEGIKTVFVSNGYINQEPLKDLLPFIDATNIDLKSFDDQFYKNICRGRLRPVLETLNTLFENGVHLEITNLVIPKENDDPKTFEKMCEWIKEELSDEIPFHISRFRPLYKMRDKKPTKKDSLMQRYDIAKKYLKYVYIGNIDIKGVSDTFCPECNNLIISRNGFKADTVFNGVCLNCKKKIYGEYE